MTSERIKEIQFETAYPQSVSVMTALKKVWNECEIENKKTLSAILGAFQNDDIDTAIKLINDKL